MIKMQFNFFSKRTKLLKIVVILLLFNLASIYFIINNNIFVISTLENNSNSINLPKTSDNEITIVTPENKTYPGPMSGYYPATYGFENELEGNSGTIIDYVDIASISSGCEVQIYDEFQGNKKVLRIHDGNTDGNAGAQQNFASTLTNGSIEWWWSTPVSGTNNIAYHFHEGIMASHVGRVLMWDNTFQDMEDNVIQSYVANQWYHHKVVFNTTSDTYDWYIDGILKVDDGDFLNPVTNIGSTEIKGGWTSTGSCYIDAIGYSWDPNYNVGDNLKEGLLLSYENSTNLDWIGYSLDGLSNKTITGNTTIPLTPNGPHNIQMYGNNSIGTMYGSTVRYFTVNISAYIDIITPENKTYTEPMSGYYPGTFGFENELEGNSGSTIDYVDVASISSSCEVEIYDEFQGRKKVLRIHDGNAAGNAGAQNNFASTLTTGSIEWWWSTPVSGSNNIAYHFHEGVMASHVGRVLMWDNTFQDMEDNVIQSYVANQWYHHKVVFNTTSDTYDWYIDGILKVDDGDFLNPVTNIGSTEIKGGWTSTGSCYIDAIGYSWDTDYQIGYNEEEGLLLSYDSSITLDTVTYSLDGGTNKTILGNTTIPLPEDGYHNIQVFGNDSSGRMYNSETQYFSVDALEVPPEIPGFNLPILFTLLGLITIISIKIKKNKIK